MIVSCKLSSGMTSLSSRGPGFRRALGFLPFFFAMGYLVYDCRCGPRKGATNWGYRGSDPEGR